MTPEELFEKHQHLAKKTVYKMFLNVDGIAKQHRIEVDDLIQIAYTGLWKGCLSYQKDKGKFVTHAINNIRFHILERLRRETDLIKYDINKKFTLDQKYRITSIDKKLKDNEDYDTYHEVMPSNVSIEHDAIDDIISSDILSKLDDTQKKIVYLMIVKEMQLKEIGKMWNMTGENVRRILNKSKRKLHGYVEVVS